MCCWRLINGVLLLLCGFSILVHLTILREHFFKLSCGYNWQYYILVIFFCIHLLARLLASLFIYLLFNPQAYLLFEYSVLWLKISLVRLSLPPRFRYLFKYLQLCQTNSCVTNAITSISPLLLKWKGIFH